MLSPTGLLLPGLEWLGGGATVTVSLCLVGGLVVMSGNLSIGQGLAETDGHRGVIKESCRDYKCMSGSRNHKGGGEFESSDKRREISLGTWETPELLDGHCSL